jgi:hypothetical protein
VESLQGMVEVLERGQDGLIRSNTFVAIAAGICLNKP